MLTTVLNQRGNGGVWKRVLKKKKRENTQGKVAHKLI